MRSSALLLSATMIAIGLCAERAQAQLEDPATLHIGSGANTQCATGGTTSAGPCQYIYQNTEVNAVGANTLDIYQSSNGAASLINPILLILGVPNDHGSALSSSTITGATLFAPYPGSQTASLSIAFGSSAYGLNGNGYQGAMGAGQEIYSFLALPGKGLDNSNSFTNWAAADAAVDSVTASDFGVYVFAISDPSASDTGFGGNDLINIDFTSLPEGTFAVAYGQDSNHVYVDPFTESGNMDTPPVRVPEPASLTLFGAALLGLGLFRRRQRGTV